MDVERAVPGQLEDSGRQVIAVRSRHKEVRLERLQSGNEVGVAGLFGREDGRRGEAALVQRKRGHGAGGRRAVLWVAASWAGRLRDHASYLKSAAWRPRGVQ